MLNPQQQQQFKDYKMDLRHLFFTHMLGFDNKSNAKKNERKNHHKLTISAFQIIATRRMLRYAPRFQKKKKKFFFFF
jgi:hypothetical protein